MLRICFKSCREIKAAPELTNSGAAFHVLQKD